MRYTWFALLWSVMVVGSVSKFQDQSNRFRFFLVPQENVECVEVSLYYANHDYENIYAIYDENDCYGFYRCLAPYIFTHVDNPDIIMQRFLNVQTGDWFDLEPIFKQPYFHKYSE